MLSKTFLGILREVAAASTALFTILATLSTLLIINLIMLTALLALGLTVVLALLIKLLALERKSCSATN